MSILVHVLDVTWLLIHLIPHWSSVIIGWLLDRWSGRCSVGGCLDKFMIGSNSVCWECFVCITCLLWSANRLPRTPQVREFISKNLRIHAPEECRTLPVLRHWSRHIIICANSCTYKMHQFSLNLVQIHALGKCMNFCNSLMNANASILSYSLGARFCIKLHTNSRTCQVCDFEEGSAKCMLG